MEPFFFQGMNLLAQLEQHEGDQHGEPAEQVPTDPHPADPIHPEEGGHEEGGHTGTVEHASGDAHGATAHHGPGFMGLMIYLFGIIAVIMVLMGLAKKGLNARFFTNKITSWFEQLYLFLENLATGIIGAHGRKYIPMLMVFWTVIFVGSVTALFFPTSPTADLSFNLGMAIIAIFYVQYEGVRANGFFGHLKHFAGPSMGIGLIVINIMLFVIELVSESMKMVSLSLRLYGNIDGGHQAADAMNALGADIYIPFGAFLLPIKMLTCVVQALIFCLLLCVYLSLVTHHDHGDDHAEDHGHPEPAHAH